MRIGINAFPLRNNGGGARYVFTGLLDALLAQDKSNKYIIFTHFEGLRMIHEVLRNHLGALGEHHTDARVRVVEIADPGQVFGYRNEFDICFAPLNNLQPRLYDRPTVAILHDIQEQYFPQYFSEDELNGRNEDYPEICRAATTLIAISESVKQSFIEKFGIDSEKIKVVYNAPQAKLVGRPSEDRGIWTRSALPEAFFFYPANTYLHKNHKLLLDALEKIRARDGDCPHIVFSGHELAGGFPLKAEIAKRKLDDRTSFHTELSVDEMRYLFCHAIATLMPTNYEGFGMPAVEAQACSCPLICTDLPALREIAGDSALYFPMNDVDALIAQIDEIRRNSTLRSQLIEKGRASAARFNWAASAEKLLDIFRKADQRFRFGPSGVKPDSQPRVGIIIRLTLGGGKIVETIKSILACGYHDLCIRVIAQAKDLSPHLKNFFAMAQVQVIDTGADAPLGYDALAQFAADRKLDLVGEILEGHMLTPSAMDSVAWGYHCDPSKPVLLGEALEWKNGHLMRAARLRLTGAGLWKMEGFLYPEMMFVNPTLLSQWPASAEATKQDPIEWRWDLLRLARLNDKLLLLRRTLADCDVGSVPPWTRYHATKSGMHRYYHVQGNEPLKVSRIAVFQPVLKLFAKALPTKWQNAGTRLWYKMIHS